MLSLPGVFSLIRNPTSSTNFASELFLLVARMCASGGPAGLVCFSAEEDDEHPPRHALAAIASIAMLVRINFIIRWTSGFGLYRNAILNSCCGESRSSLLRPPFLRSTWHGRPTPAPDC